MLLSRLGPDGLLVLTLDDGESRVLFSDPYATPFGAWELGRRVDLARAGLLAPVVPSKIVGVGRNYREHAAELGNPMPAEPLLFLKSPSSIVGPQAAVVLPPESERVEFEGELAVVVRERLCRASRAEAEQAILGITCACDVTARDLQRRDATFARGKSFDTFCPVGPSIRLGPPDEETTVVTRINGGERQRGVVRDMAWDPAELLSYISRMMTLEPGDLVLTGTPAGVGPLADGDRIEVEIEGVGVLANPVEAWRQS